MCVSESNAVDEVRMMCSKLPTMRRIGEIAVSSPDFSKEDLSRLYAAFEQLSVLKKFSVPEMMEPGREVFQRDHDAYRERMAWINGFMMSKGYPEPIFRDLESFETSSDDYDYFYELKTPEQLAEEEALRNG